MKTLADIAALLDELEHRIADDLEGQDLDFKQWPARSRDDAVRKMVDMAVCMANGGGGTVVFGVADKARGRDRAILGVPPEIDPNLLIKAVYDRTEPKIMPVFEQLMVPEGTGRLLLMHVYPGLPPYTDSAGRGGVRMGKDCVPLTGTLRRKLAVETGETDYTAEIAADMDSSLLSPTALEALRDQARRERAPEDLLHLADAELLSALGLLKQGRLTRAAVFLAGTEAALREHLPGVGWTFLKMRSDTDYDIREDGPSALPLALRRMEELLAPFNPIATLEQGLFHYEYRTWPQTAVREALMNALCHADMRIAGPVMVKVHDERLEIGNNGGFIAGIRPDNILHHPPAARNPLLVEALTRLRLVNRSNLGIGRMFAALLCEGKDAPHIQEIGESVLLTFPKQELNAAFRRFVWEESEQGRNLGVDEFLVLRRLLQHHETDTQTAAALCQRDEAVMHRRLADMERAGYVEHGGAGRGAYWTIHPELDSRLHENGGGEARRRIAWDAAKTRILSILMERAKRGEAGLTNQEIRRITRYDRWHVIRMMKELRAENPKILPPGRGKYVRYEYRP